MNEDVQLSIEDVIGNLNAIHSNLTNDLSVRLATAQATITHLQRENAMLRERVAKLNNQISTPRKEAIDTGLDLD